MAFVYAWIVPLWADQLLPQLLMEQFDTWVIQCRHIEHMHEGVYNFVCTESAEIFFSKLIVDILVKLWVQNVNPGAKCRKVLLHFISLQAQDCASIYIYNKHNSVQAKRVIVHIEISLL